MSPCTLNWGDGWMVAAKLVTYWHCTLAQRWCLSPKALYIIHKPTTQSTHAESSETKNSTTQTQSPVNITAVHDVINRQLKTLRSHFILFRI